MRSWADICADKSLQDLPYKIETNRFDQIVMSPANNWHSDYQSEIAFLLRKLMPDGRALSEVAVQTTDGVKVPDAAWISLERFRPYRRASYLPVAPEVCVEVVSPGNRKYEIQGKMQLYFAQGAQEVWLCDDQGNMEFFLHDSEGPVAKSRLCPDFPLKIGWE
ncbi:putative restriction endonuclease [Prosthecobacter fusiformis]|uniref:Putative restriction endonuclease n=1 Tax=Prosthecobacter fusiformis TaxID=48464 RepID=A0A4R7SR14_9BACT|nr:Uma2 family endonuclease [Prosthecobacter fusiformis]TDU81521.1 putative restriction endonuclease [Prosthecobacter fusiformis]